MGDLLCGACAEKADKVADAEADVVWDQCSSCGRQTWVVKVENDDCAVVDVLMDMLVNGKKSRR